MASFKRFKRYLAKAFTYHWNLLAVGAGGALAAITGRPDIVLPFLAAGEVLYLAGLSTNNRFQKAIDAADQAEEQAPKAANTQLKAQQMIDALGRTDRQRFEGLKEVCERLRSLAKGVKNEASAMADDLTGQATAINHLLWIYLKLMYSKTALEHFFSTIDTREIKRDIDQSKKLMERFGPAEEDDESEAKRRKTLMDTLATSEARLSNYEKAVENYQFIELEIDRLHAKISNLAEMGINRQDPDYITSEVDAVTESVAATEKVMLELDLLDGLDEADEIPPEFLEEQRMEL